MIADQPLTAADAPLPPGSQDILAYIDGYQAGIFHGWALDQNHPDAPVAVQLFVGQDLVAEGLAEHHRIDLEQAGVGTGHHAFRLRLLKPLASGKAHDVTMVCNGTERPATFTGFTLTAALDWRAGISGIEGCWVAGEFRSDTQAPAAIQCSLLVDGEPAGSFEVPFDGVRHAYPFRHRLPDRYFDGMAHLVTVAMIGDDACEAATVDILRPIATPWQYVATGAGAAGRLYSGLPAQVSRRLTTFQARIGQAAANGAADEVRNVWQALQSLNDGHANRRAFPRLELPALPEGTEPEVSVVIPARDKFELTYHCIASLILSSNECTYEVIVVDDCSSDETVRIADIIGNVRVVTNPVNLGFLRSCNKAAQAARGRYITLLNNDTEAGDRWLDEMRAVFLRFDNVGAVGAKLIHPDGTLQEAGGIVWDDGTPANLGRGDNPCDPKWNYVRQADYLSGAALMLPRAVWDQVGGFSDEFAPAYYEDTDLAFKVRAAGYRTFYTPHAEIVHMEGMSHGKDTARGLKKQQLVNAPRFREKWSEAYANNGRADGELWRNKDRGIRRRALVIDHATPQPDKDAGSHAAIQQMRLLQSHGFKLTFVPENLAHEGQYTIDLQKMGIECMHAPFCLSIEELLQRRGHEFDLVFIARYGVAENHIDAIRTYTQAKVLFNNVDLHFLRELRARIAAGDPDLSEPLATRDRELALMQKVDAILSYNEAEHVLILSHNLRGDNVFKCPWVVDGRGHRTPFEEREGLAFLGGYRHPPNIEAVEFLAERVMPLLRATGRKITVRIHGSHVPKAFEAWAADDFVIAGYADDLDEVFERCRIFVAPLLSGAGIKGKVVEAMSRGVPCVLSPVAAEATGLSNGVSATIAETPQEWVDAILELYDDRQKWIAYSTHSLALSRNNHSFDTGRKMIGKALAYLGFFSGPAQSYVVADHPTQGSAR